MLRVRWLARRAIAPGGHPRTRMQLQLRRAAALDAALASKEAPEGSRSFQSSE